MNYIILIKKYLPSAIIIIIIIVVTTNNIFAQNYSADEYATRTLLSNIIPKSEDEVGWSELIEETGPATNQAPMANYLDDQGTLQQLVVNTPFAETENIYADTSPDSSSLVLLSPEDTGSDTPVEISRTKLVEYTIQPGDVIGAIAEKFGVSANTILWENNLTWNSTIRPGQKINILQDSGISHKVVSGDTILAIAKKYQADAENIVAANKLADSSDISIGELLFIPDGVRPTRVVSSYTPPSASNFDDVPSSASVDSGSKLLWPVLSHRITQYYTWRHSGLDIGDKTGNPIYAAEAGKVEKAGWNSGGYGNYVIINHGNGLQTLYGHASKVLVSAGDSVSRGETIALVGSTGRSTGPHLHLEVKVNGVRQNPINYIK
ncbi:MAG: peptidoglycan DD-metalloendopeptidase family protein [Patescibacteria group bacterium]|jgi:LysM repeat protein